MLWKWKSNEIEKNNFLRIHNKENLIQSVLQHTPVLAVMHNLLQIPYFEMMKKMTPGKKISSRFDF